MNSSEIYKVIQTVASTSKTNDKLAILKENAKCDLFKKVIFYALNPQFVYGIIPNTSWSVKGDSIENRQDNFSETTFQLLDDLINRNLTGHAARDAILNHIFTLNDESIDLLIRIIRKDFRSGFSESSANKVWKGLIPKYPYMRCSLPEDSAILDQDYINGVISQVKLDGMFSNANCISESVQCTSRQGTNIPMEKIPQILEDLKHIDGHQLHGEFTIEEDGKTLPRQISNGIITSFVKGDGELSPSQRLIYTVWDAIPLEAATPKGKYEKPYIERLKHLESIIVDCKDVRVVEYRILHSKEECVSHAKEMNKLGLEGTVVKHPNMIWKDGTSKYQIKLKIVFDVDLQIYGIGEGQKDTKVEGRPATIQCRSSCGQVLVNVTVKNEKMRDVIEFDISDWIDKIVTVRANDIMKPTEKKITYSLFLPRLVEDVYRIDKDVADDLLEIGKQYNNAIKL